MLVYIFRHGLADFGKKGVEDPGLNDQGTADVKNVVELCSTSFGFKPKVIASSPLLRAMETAKLTKDTLLIRSDVVVDECLYGDKKPRPSTHFYQNSRKVTGLLLYRICHLSSNCRMI